MEEHNLVVEEPLFDSGNPSNEALNERISANACQMPPCEYVFKDQHSLQEFERYDAFKSRKIHCPLCPVGPVRLTNAVYYQGHMTTHHSCAHLFACHFCGLLFPSLEALKAHDGCAEFAAALVQRINAFGEVECCMNFATLVMVCTDCGSQLLIRSSFIGESSISHWNDIVNFHMRHNAEKLVPLVIYSHEDFNCKMRLRLQVVSPLIKDIQIECPYCEKCDFDNVEMLESHFLSHKESVKKVCPECSNEFSQEAFFREHLLSHLGTKACYLALYLSRICTFITGGVPSCGPNLAKGSELIYGGVSTAIFNSKLRLQFVDPYESMTVKKKSNKRSRKRRAGPACEEVDEMEEDRFSVDEVATKLQKLLGYSFDSENVLRINSFFYTAINSKDETEELSAAYNASNIDLEYLVEDPLFGNGTKLADDVSKKFMKYCRLAGGKSLSKKHNPAHSGLSAKIFMCRRCHCICTGIEDTYSHLALCCPELRREENSVEPFDLSNGLLVFCVYAGGGVPNTRITCWECSSSVCSVFGLRVHMIYVHGMFLKVEDESDMTPDEAEKFTSTTRAINKAIGLTENGGLPVNLEERKKEALKAKMKLSQNAEANKSSCIQSNVDTSLCAFSPSLSKSPSKPATSIATATSQSIPPLVILDDAPTSSVQIIDHTEPQTIEIVNNQMQPSPSQINGSTVRTLEMFETEHSEKTIESPSMANSVEIVALESVNIDEFSLCSTDAFSQEEIKHKSEFTPLEELSQSQEQDDLQNAAIANTTHNESSIRFALLAILLIGNSGVRILRPWVAVSGCVDKTL
ncbi:unnamed protein product [Strongylus vulgaris]|uniref:C2H2-type domain-containing protein n=1 Tax=Strongylus vulgaris TaxID=40348 RepID=A0A3P7KBD6_STRVU|nr:unnamed protein product [Strongylus vulgaris]